MAQLILSLVVFMATLGFVAAYTVAKRTPAGPLARLARVPPGGAAALTWGGLIAALALFLPLHWVSPGGREIVLLDRVFMGSSLKEGRLIATQGERGLQAKFLPPGFQFEPFVGVFFNVTTVPYTEIPVGHYGLVHARDGLPLDESAVLAPPVPASLFLDPIGFMDGTTIDGITYRGTKGLQTTILRPGSYPINTHLFKVEVNELPPTDPRSTRVTQIPNGFVGVVRSSVDEGRRPDFLRQNPGDPVDCGEVTEATVGSVSVELVPVGCRGTWREALPPGNYLLNRAAYEITLVETRTIMWAYRGGYDSSRIDLELSNDGGVAQTRTPVTVPSDPQAAGDAVTVWVEGWPVHVDVRVLVQIGPDQAPATIAAIGDVDNVRARFITPAVRSSLRNIGGSEVLVPNRLAYDAALAELDAVRARVELLRSGASPDTLTDQALQDEIARLTAEIAAGEAALPDPDERVTRPTLVLDFIESREILERLVKDDVQVAGRNAGVTIVDVRFGNVDIPPELLVARRREQLATQFRQATVQERLAQQERIATERERATADQQPKLVTAQIGVQTSELEIERQENQGKAQRFYLEQIAAGRRAQVAVLGEERVFLLEAFSSLLAAVTENPEILTGLQLPRTLTVNIGLSGEAGLATLGTILSGTELLGGPRRER